MRKLELTINESFKYIVIFLYSFLIMVSGFLFNSPDEIMEGLKRIFLSPSILVTDYMVVGNIGSALFNCGIIMLICMLIIKVFEVQISGPVVAAVFTVGGFALFGKNLYNIWSIIIGVYLHSLYFKESFNKFILVAFFGTALGPLISQFSFGFGLNLVPAIILANLFGLIIGFILPILASSFVKFHQGFNLYNLGFTAGITGTIFMALFRSFGLNHQTVNIVASGNNRIFSIYLSILFLSMIILGFVLNGLSFKGYKKLNEASGRLVTDFINLNGFGLTLVNMGILGLVSTLYIILVKGELNGPIIGGIFTIVGFGAFGKHVKNIVPIMIGVLIAANLQTWEINSTGALLAALFGTTLAPITGTFGWKYGILAGFLHMAMVMNVGFLHGGMNLYNNGLSGGFVAAILVPIIDALKKGD